MGKPTGNFPPGERWDGARTHVVFTLVLQGHLPDGKEERIDCRATAEAIEKAVPIYYDDDNDSDNARWVRLILDGFRKTRRSKFEPAADRLLKAGRIGDGDNGRRYILIGEDDV